MKLLTALALPLALAASTCSPSDRASLQPLARTTAALGWSATGGAVRRYWHAAVPMLDGRVLVAGGNEASAEIFDPVAKTWTSAGAIAEAKIFLCGGRLPSGKILIAAGEVANDSRSSVDIYDPQTQAWAPGPSTIRPRGRCHMIALKDGRLLIHGNWSTAEVFDETTQTWTETGPLNQYLREVEMVRLPTDKILKVGGDTGSGPTKGAEVLDPVTLQWTATGSMSQARISHVVAALPNGNVLAIGGDYGGALSTTEIWNAGTGTWSAGPSMHVGRKTFGGGVLPDGKILVAFGGPVASAEVFDPVSSVWTYADGATNPRIYTNAVTSTNGSIVFTGGMSATNFQLYGEAEVFTQQGLGKTCKSGGECASLLCVDGVCCSSTCAGTCSACDVPGSLGTCTTVGAAAPRAPRSCAPFGKCSGGACVTSCAIATDCTSDRYCVAPSCVPKKEVGLACGASEQCLSGFCVDGVCCDSACTDQCAACDVVGAFGTCSPVIGQPRGGRAACSGVAVGTTCGQQCTGTDTSSCGYPTTSIACGADGCANGVAVRAGACDGAGLCSTTATPCGAYACSGKACGISCSTATDCAAGHYCSAGTCIAIEGLGAACTTAATCATGNCVEGVCCASATCPTGSTCAAPGRPGRCVRQAGESCTLGDECGSGFCVDGVCCDSACEGQCEACDSAATKGVCTPVVGSPHAARKACDGGELCAARACDGVARTSCDAYAAGVDVVCKPAACNGDALTLQGRCDGKGGCADGASSSCLPFACTGRACATTCTTDAECGTQFRCNAGACVASAATCAADGISSIPTGGEPRSCAPYRCQPSGECGIRCDGSSQCAPGALCDPASSACTTGGGAAVEESGCSMNPRTSSRGTVPFALSALAILVARRRRARAQRPRAALAVLAAILVAVAACSSGGRAPVQHVTHATLAIVRANGAFAPRLAAARKPTRATGLARALPRTTLEPLELHPRGAIVRVQALDLRAVDGELVDEAMVFTGVAPQTDALLLQTDAVTEELRVLRGPSAPSTMRWRLSSELSFAVERGLVVGRDATKNFVLRAEELDAVDAAGARRVARVTIERGAEGTVLVASFDLVGLRYPIVVDPAWSMGPLMSEERREHAAVKMEDGRVLIAGGTTGSNTLTSADIYDPIANTITAAAPMAIGRAAFSLLLMKSGKVWAGGGPAAGSNSEIYDPQTNSWAGVPYHYYGNGVHVMLDDGRVLSVGGLCQKISSVYDPATNAWTDLPPMLAVRLDAMVVKLTGGKVLAMRGSSCPSGQEASAELFNPVTNSWDIAQYPQGIPGGSVLLAIPGNKALLTGGYDSTAALLYDGNTNTWTAVASMHDRRHSHAMALLPNGRTFVLGGQDVLTAEVYDSVTNVWSRAGQMSRTHLRYPLTPLPSGALLLSGGFADLSGTLSTTELFTLVPNGGTCTDPGECFSGFCLSGICCNKACAGVCEACDLAGSIGSCSSVTAGEPHYGRSCNGLMCSTGSCLGSCSGDAECVSGFFCSSGACLAKQPPGGACITTNECAAGVCSDGVCCDRACTGQCEACDLPATRGKCTGKVGAPRVGRPACTGAGAGTECGSACDGKDLVKCTYAPTTTFCSASTCSSGVESHASFCDGAGSCRDVATGCGAYSCGPLTCRVDCATDAHCAPGHFCKGSTCTKPEGLGSACTGPSSCATGSCVDGVCCAVAFCEPGSTCAAPGKAGTCSKRNGASCTIADECGGGLCVDGVCCDRACDGQCEACAVTGSIGTCIAVVGAPRGARAACDAGGSEPCKARACDGTDGASCAAFAPATVSCAQATCAGSTFTAAGSCDGKGGCAAAATTSCTPYACDDQGCLGSCVTDAQCADGFSCVKGVCEAKRARCSDDTQQSIDVDGTTKDCAPYRCGPTGACLAACATSTDCGGGAACDGKTCVPVSGAAPAEEGGCAYASHRRRGDAAWLLVIGLVVTARRRVRARGRWSL